MSSRKPGYDKRQRDGTTFLTIPHIVADSSAYLTASAKARALLVDIARQVHGRNNGLLVCTMGYMASRGWKSEMTLLRAKEELIAHKLIAETKKGGFPNSASLYGVTWLALNESKKLDITAASFPRGSYQQYKPPEKPPTHFRKRGRKTLPIKTEAKPYQKCSYPVSWNPGSPIKTEAIRPQKARLALSKLECSIESTRQYPGLGGMPGGGSSAPEIVYPSDPRVRHPCILKRAKPTAPSPETLRRWGQPMASRRTAVELAYEPADEPIPDYDDQEASQ